MLWTQEMDAKLRDLRKVGFSFSECSKLMGGVSKSACIARMKRNDFGQGSTSQSAKTLAVKERPKPPTTWTQERVERLRALASAGSTSTEIAAELGVSRGSVLSKASGCGIKIGSRDAVTATTLNLRMAARQRQAEKISAAALKDGPEGGIGFMELTMTTCRRPLWDDDARPSVDEQRYCGAETDVGKSFCPACRSRLWVPSPLRSITQAPRSVA